MDARMLASLAGVAVLVAACASTPPSPSPSEGPAAVTGATPTPGATDSWPGRVVATFVAEADALTYDTGRQVVWIAVTQSSGPDYLYRYDPAQGTTSRWVLPATTYAGVLAQVLVDDSGAVWVNDDGYRLVRFDPAHERMTSIVLALKVPGTDWANGGTWVSAIAADGDGVLVARNGVPTLTRLGPSLAVTATIALPSGFAGATGLAVAGGHLFLTAGGPAAAIARLSMDGRLEARFVTTADRLTPPRRWGRRRPYADARRRP